MRSARSGGESAASASFTEVVDPMNDYRSIQHPEISPLRRQIARQRDQVLDLDIMVDAARSELNQTVVRLGEAVRRRDEACRHLARLLEWSEDAAA